MCPESSSYTQRVSEDQTGACPESQVTGRAHTPSHQPQTSSSASRPNQVPLSLVYFKQNSNSAFRRLLGCSFLQFTYYF